jgi:hypothetical protein
MKSIAPNSAAFLLVAIGTGVLSGCGIEPARSEAGGLTDVCQGVVSVGPHLRQDGGVPSSTESVARTWNEQALAAIRLDLPRPTVHARNLFHLSAAMYDAWASYDAVSDGYFLRERHSAIDPADARHEAISFAAYRVLAARYARSSSAVTTAVALAEQMRGLGYDPCYRVSEGAGPAQLGNRIAEAVLTMTLEDGSNEANDYADTTDWVPENEPLVVALPGPGVQHDPDHWQPLALDQRLAQNGIIEPGKVQNYVGAQWRDVRTFALRRTELDEPYFDLEAPPLWDTPETRAFVLDVIRREAFLDPALAETIDVSPGAYGNNSLGENDGLGHPLNPVTGAPYAPHVVPRADFGRVLAEFWADGPHSETPPGHWNVIANTVADDPGFVRRYGGVGPELDRLEWDVKLYFVLNGALHDAAIAAWEVKRRYLCARPISLIRYMGTLGQSSDSSLPHYDPNGLPLEPGTVELVSAESSAPGGRHEHLAGYVGEVAVRAWRGEPDDPGTQVGGGVWRLATAWFPYQRKTFVTPAFPGFISGHSTFSRAAAEVLAAVNGSAYFPGGLGEFVARRGEYLMFEEGPSVDVHLQWATYFDAADQAGQSRIWGGIHLEPDDLVGRRTGALVGRAALEEAARWLEGTAAP